MSRATTSKLTRLWWTRTATGWRFAQVGLSLVAWALFSLGAHCSAGCQRPTERDWTPEIRSSEQRCIQATLDELAKIVEALDGHVALETAEHEAIERQVVDATCALVQHTRRAGRPLVVYGPLRGYDVCGRCKFGKGCNLNPETP